MEFLSLSWWSALAGIVLIDLVLAGDNAIVIAMAAQKLPPHIQRRAIFWGTVGALVVRALMTLCVVWLLQWPGLRLIGGLGLVWIAYTLLAGADDETAQQTPASSFAAAMKTIIIADALMGIDNVLGVAGAAHGAIDLVLLGLLLSVPIMVVGSTLVLKAIERYPVIVDLGGAVLVWTAASMVTQEPLLAPLWAWAPWVQWTPYALFGVGVFMAARHTRRQRHL
jgi:YjbE family integral membrane protein